ncbi:histidine phosphatase family protein [Deferribacterales bacterium RsTz2092]|nr:phosphoglycerate mutase [Deferribacterales bacterium]
MKLRIPLFSNEFYFIRHGETEYNANGFVTGELDVPLNALGESQASLAALAMTNIDIRSCIISPMKRAVQTAEKILENREDVRVITLDDLEERHWGKLAGKDKSTIDSYILDDMGVERWTTFTERVLRALASIQQMNIPVLIVAHSGTFRVISQYLQTTTIIRPIQNAYPYRFYQVSGIWRIDTPAMKIRKDRAS